MPYKGQCVRGLRPSMGHKGFEWHIYHAGLKRFGRRDAAGMVSIYATDFGPNINSQFLVVIFEHHSLVNDEIFNLHQLDRILRSQE